MAEAHVVSASIRLSTPTTATILLVRKAASSTAHTSAPSLPLPWYLNQNDTCRGQSPVYQFLTNKKVEGDGSVVAASTRPPGSTGRALMVLLLLHDRLHGTGSMIQSCQRPPCLDRLLVSATSMSSLDGGVLVSLDFWGVLQHMGVART